MLNIPNYHNETALTELRNNYNALPWYKKLFYPSAVSAALEQHHGAPSYDLAVTVHNACLRKTWFFQRWLFPSLVSFSSLSLGADLTPPPAEMTTESFKIARLFQPEPMAAKLLLLVVKGRQDKALAMLKQYPELLLKPADVTDYSDRTFKKITAYEYAYWAKDTHMCRMLEAHMDVNTKAAMLERINAMEMNGLTYKQQGIVVEHSKHFDFTPLITALTRYVQGYDNWFDMWDFKAMNEAWRDVGMAQLDMPVHVVNEYCRPDRSFYPLPEFNEKNLPRSVRFYNYKDKLKQSWFSLLIPGAQDLGVHFALRRGDNKTTAWVPRSKSFAGGPADADWAAVNYLDEVRPLDLTLSRQNLLPTDLEPALNSLLK